MYIRLLVSQQLKEYNLSSVITHGRSALRMRRCGRLHGRFFSFSRLQSRQRAVHLKRSECQRKCKEVSTQAIHGGKISFIYTVLYTVYMKKMEYCK